MTAQLEFSLGSFSQWAQGIAGWIQATDDHAAHHLSLLEKVGGMLDGDVTASTAECRQMAVKLERYRYQHFNEHGDQWSPEHDALVDWLDLAANRLAGRPNRPPRATRQAIRDVALDRHFPAAALAALDGAIPLETVIRRARELTRANFGAIGGAAASGARRRMFLYAPLYVSNECVNYCTYCGFRYPCDIVRKHLSVAEGVAQAKILCRHGFRHVLLCGGDFPGRTTVAYCQEMIAAVRALGMAPAIEVAPQNTDAYVAFIEAGIYGLALYQETYDPRRYGEYHIRGPKSSFQWRLETHDRAAEAGVDRFGLGILLGLAKPEDDLRAMMRHAAYLADRFPGRTWAFSLPRIHQAPAGFTTAYPISDETLIRFYCVLRLAFPRAELVLSTREPVALRSRLARICITQMSAGSSTAPGGYLPDGQPAGEQFPISDHRAPAAVVAWLEREGFQALSLPDLPWCGPRGGASG